eukprot:Cvel_12672.t1-p1 / transcript=Cvel_12672.t1 / gene=Cvel_12672 / organism=Chromera_velia_CCMP2878 / gene_product=hypothetical protein / transcript_product=hypothetical protein / location=Cvel_scaffold838:479-1907(-) / protein_length=243 / sequence_SO=supercontig / SO=protein_coding / is_pseudo=false
MSLPHEHDAVVAALENSPAYRVLVEKGLIETKYRLRSANDLDFIKPNSSASRNCCCSSLCCCCRICGCLKTTEVSNGRLKLMEDGGGSFFFLGPGNHLLWNLFARLDKNQKSFSSGVIKHGDRTICIVEQGFIGLAMDRGQPVLLPPGLHQWISPTLVFEKEVDLNNVVIKLGPYTLVKVDEGYAAVTSDNGSQKILEGGTCNFLTHRNWKFEKFLSQKIQADDLNRIKSTSADNVLMETDAS